MKYTITVDLEEHHIAGLRSLLYAWWGFLVRVLTAPAAHGWIVGLTRIVRALEHVRDLEYIASVYGMKTSGPEWTVQHMRFYREGSVWTLEQIDGDALRFDDYGGPGRHTIPGLRQCNRPHTAAGRIAECLRCEREAGRPTP